MFGYVTANIRELTEAQKQQNRLHFGLVFQSFNLFPQYTARENVALAPKLLKRGTDREIDEKALMLLKQVGLESKADFYPYQLSGGQQQRVAIARALVGNPSILLADEPTGALDQKTGRQVMALFEELNREGHTVIMITHDMNIAAYAHRVIHIIDGEVLEEAGEAHV